MCRIYDNFGFCLVLSVFFPPDHEMRRSGTVPISPPRLGRKKRCFSGRWTMVLGRGTNAIPVNVRKGNDVFLADADGSFWYFFIRMPTVRRRSRAFIVARCSRRRMTLRSRYQLMALNG